MAEETKSASESIDYAELAKTGTTAEVLALTNQLREAKKAETDKAIREYAFPTTYNPKMGLNPARTNCGCLPRHPRSRQALSGAQELGERAAK